MFEIILFLISFWEIYFYLITDFYFDDKSNLICGNSYKYFFVKNWLSKLNYFLYFTGNIYKELYLFKEIFDKFEIFNLGMS